MKKQIGILLLALMIFSMMSVAVIAKKGGNKPPKVRDVCKESSHVTYTRPSGDEITLKYYSFEEYPYSCYDVIFDTELCLLYGLENVDKPVMHWSNVPNGNRVDCEPAPTHEIHSYWASEIYLPDIESPGFFPFSIPMWGLLGEEEFVNGVKVLDTFTYND